MKKTALLTISIILMPFYITAYAISYLLKLNGYEDMETPTEWIEIIKSIPNVN